LSEYVFGLDLELQNIGSIFHLSWLY